MAFDRTALVENVSPALYLHGYSASEVAPLFAVAKFENQKKRQQFEGKIPADDAGWLQTYCRAGVPRLAFERGVSLSAARQGLARAKHDGLIDVVDRGALPAYRRLNVQAWEILKRAGKPRDLFLKCKGDKKFNLGELDWGKYLCADDLEFDIDLSSDQIKLLRQRPEKTYYASTLVRDACYLWLRKRYSDEFTFQRASDKPEAKSSAPVRPFLLVSHPHGAGAPYVYGEPEPPSSSQQEEDADDFENGEEYDYACE